MEIALVPSLLVLSIITVTWSSGCWKTGFGSFTENRAMLNLLLNARADVNEVSAGGSWPGLPEDRERIPISIRRKLRDCRKRRQQSDS